MPDLVAIPTSVSFGSTSVGLQVSQNVALQPKNIEEGVSVYAVLLIGASGPFSLTETLDQPVLQKGVAPYGNSTLIDAGTSQTIAVNFKPTAPGSYTATLRIMFNGVGMPGQLDIPLAGTGV